MDWVRNWQESDYAELLEYMQSLADRQYCEFNAKLVPGIIDPMGIRVPILRKLAKEIAKGDFRSFLAVSDGGRYEEVMLRGMVMAAAKTDYDEMLAMMKAFAPEITNWAICDVVDFKGIKKHRGNFWRDSRYFIGHSDPWHIRFGLGEYLAHYLDDEYIEGVLERSAAVSSDFYYVKMMQAWLWATAFAKCRNQTLEFFKTTRMDAETAKMTIGKLRDSSRVSKEDAGLAKGIILNNIVDK